MLSDTDSLEEGGRQVQYICILSTVDVICGIVKEAASFIEGMDNERRLH